MLIEDYIIQNYKNIYFIDEDIKYTTKRLFKHSPLSIKVLLILSNIFKPLFILANSKPNSEQYENAEFDPPEYLIKSLIKPRDKYMANKIKLFIEKHKPKEVIAIVGKGHIPGIIQHLQ